MFILNFVTIILLVMAREVFIQFVKMRVILWTEMGLSKSDAAKRLNIYSWNMGRNFVVSCNRKTQFQGRLVVISSLDDFLPLLDQLWKNIATPQNKSFCCHKHKNISYYNEKTSVWIKYDFYTFLLTEVEKGHDYIEKENTLFGSHSNGDL